MWRWVTLLVGFIALFLGPWTYQRITHSIVTPVQAQPADAALIFGAVVRNGKISPLHKERLDAAISLWEAGTVTRLVVSNQTKAATVMRQYLLNAGIPKTAIEFDGMAERTPDTCEFERDRSEKRTVVLVSQRFHLPRIALQCNLVGIRGQLVAADRTDRPNPGIMTILRVRGKRLIREAFLTWGALLRVYPD